MNLSREIKTITGNQKFLENRVRREKERERDEGRDSERKRER